MVQEPVWFDQNEDQMSNYPYMVKIKTIYIYQPVAAVTWDLIEWPLFLNHSAMNGTPRYIAFFPSSFAACLA